MYHQQGNRIIVKGKTVAVLEGGNLKFSSPHYRRIYRESLLAWLADNGRLAREATGAAPQETPAAPAASPDAAAVPARLHEPMDEADAAPLERPAPHPHFGQYTAEWLVYDVLSLPKGSFLEKWREMSRRNTATFAAMVAAARTSPHAAGALARLSDYKLLPRT